MNILAFLALGAMLLAPSMSFANFEQQMGLKEFGSPVPALHTTAPLADEHIQRMALHMDEADCAELLALPKDVKEAFFITQLYLQRPGSLSNIIGPDCEFMGPAKEVATISDPALTVTEEKESLYFLPEAGALIVTRAQQNTIAYGMFYDGNDPVAFFLDHRLNAEQSATMARMFRTEEATSSRQRAFSSSSSSNATSATSATSAASITSDQSISSLAAIEPYGPVPEPAQGSSTMMIVIIAMVLIGTVLIVIYARRTLSR
ncbi:hypothetical protein H6770_05510 [Candidatus Peribacteria bacterium]|nr:hypothetical protein [Candidatus Peribacteria bacterium]